jgi:hypothetical protein
MPEMQRFIGIRRRIFNKNYFRIVDFAFMEEVTFRNYFTEGLNPPGIRNLKIEESLDNIISFYGRESRCQMIANRFSCLFRSSL